MKTYLVFGATGQQGGATARALLARGFTPRVMVRQSTSRAAMKLAELGCDVVLGDYDAPASLATALKGCDGVFLAQPLQNPALELRQARSVIRAAGQSDCQQLVYSAALDAVGATGVAHFDSKHLISQSLAVTDLKYTVLGPGGFMENLLLEDTWRGVEAGKLITPFDLDVVQALVSVADIGRMAASVLIEPPDECGRFLPLYSEALNARQQAGALASHLGHEVVAERLPDALTLQYMGEELAGMFSFFNQRGNAELPPVDDFRRRVPDALSLQDWLQQEKPA